MPARGAVFVAQYYSRFHFYNRNTCVPFTHQFGFSLPTVQRILPTVQRVFGVLLDPLSSFVRRCILSSVCAYSFFHRIVSELQQVVGEYVKHLLGMYFVPPFSFGRGLYRDDGGPNRLFFTYLFCDKSNTIKSKWHRVKDSSFRSPRTLTVF